MRKLSILTLLVYLSIAFTLPAYSTAGENDSVSIIGGAAYIIKTSELKITNTTFKPEYNSVDLSVVFAYKKFYSRINFDQSVSSQALVDNSVSGGGDIENSIISFNREDAAITFGYSLFDSFSVFAGYKRGETSGINGGQIRVFNDDPFAPFPPIPDYIVSNTEFSITETGPFIGLSYTYFPEKTGSVNFSLAYADLDGEFSATNAEVNSAGDVILTLDETSGENTGLSYSISWTDEFSKDLNYTIGLNIIRYTFKAPPVVGGDDFDFDNNFANFSIAFSKFF